MLSVPVTPPLIRHLIETNWLFQVSYLGINYIISVNETTENSLNMKMFPQQVKWSEFLWKQSKETTNPQPTIKLKMWHFHSNLEVQKKF